MRGAGEVVPTAQHHRRLAIDEQTLPDHFRVDTLDIKGIPEGARLVTSRSHRRWAIAIVLAFYRNDKPRRSS
jgi:hypothetical protein